MASIEAMIKWMKDREGKVTYSMTNRLGPNSYDCSSSVYFSLIAGGFLPSGSMGNTDTLFGDLERNNWRQVAPVNGNYKVQRGDLFIWGARGASGGASGHTGIFVDSVDNIIHCNYGYNGITTNNHDVIWGYNGRPPITVYRSAAAKPEPPKLPTKNPEQPIEKGINYETHVSKVGWMNNVANGALSGSTGYNLPVEAVKVLFKNNQIQASVSYRAHVSSIGWMPWVKDGQLAGTTGQSKAVEAIQAKLTGEAANYYNLEYQAHVADNGWMSWVKDGATAGTTGQKKSLQALKMKLVRKPIDQGSSKPATKGVSYRMHLANEGWLGYVTNNQMAGTTGLGIESQCLEVYVDGKKENVQIDAHVAEKGWLTNTGGTTGQKLSLQAVKLKLKNGLEKQYDISYQVHVSEKGWMSWVKNGAVAGTTGQKLAIQAIRIKLTNK